MISKRRGMQRLNNRKRVFALDRRTGLDVRADKRIRMDEGGIERFDDYWTSSDEESSDEIQSPKCSSPVNLNAPRMSSYIKYQTPRQKLLEKISVAKMPSSVTRANAEKRNFLIKGRRTGTAIFATKNMKIKNGVENDFDNNWTDSALTTMQDGKAIRSSGASGRKYASLQKSLESQSSVSSECLSPQASRHLSKGNNKLSYRVETHKKLSHNETLIISTPGSSESNEFKSGKKRLSKASKSQSKIMSDMSIEEDFEIASLETVSGTKPDCKQPSHNRENSIGSQSPLSSDSLSLRASRHLTKENKRSYIVETPKNLSHNVTQVISTPGRSESNEFKSGEKRFSRASKSQSKIMSDMSIASLDTVSGTNPDCKQPSHNIEKSIDSQSPLSSDNLSPRASRHFSKENKCSYIVETPNVTQVISTPGSSERNEGKSRKKRSSKANKNQSKNKGDMSIEENHGIEIFRGDGSMDRNDIHSSSNNSDGSVEVLASPSSQTSLHGNISIKNESTKANSNKSDTAKTHEVNLNVNDPTEVIETEETAKHKKRERKENLPDVITFSSSQKNSKELNEEESDKAPLRRSSRQRFPPLEGWRNQRLQVVYKNGEIAGVELQEGDAPINVHLDTIRRRQEYNEKYRERNQKREKLLENTINLEKIKKDLHKTEVIDPNTGQKELVYLHRPHDSLLWTVPLQLNEDDAAYTITKCFSSELISFGFIEIGIGKKKEKQFSPEFNVAFNVSQGNGIEMRIHKTKLHLKKLDYVVVPAGNIYSIHNKGKTVALLSFSSFKAPIFDYQLPKSP